MEETAAEPLSPTASRGRSPAAEPLTKHTQATAAEPLTGQEPEAGGWQGVSASKMPGVRIVVGTLRYRKRL